MFPTGLSSWTVEKAHIVRLPNKLTVNGVDNLKAQLQAEANRYRPAPGKPPLGELTLRMELGEDGRVENIIAMFRDRNGLMRRFARLHRRTR